MWIRRRAPGVAQEPPTFWWALSRPILLSDPVLILHLFFGPPLWGLARLFELGVRRVP